MVAQVRRDRNAGVPNYVFGGDPSRDQIDVFSFGSAYLGPSTHPFTFVGDPSSPKFKVPNLGAAPAAHAKLRERLDLMRGLDQPPRGGDPAVTGALDGMKNKAVDLLFSDTARQAFDLSLEPTRVRERFGMHPWGQRALMARRLVEAGASWVTLVYENPMPAGVPLPPYAVYNWDSHAVNCHLFEDAKLRLPPYDQAVTALVDDLYDRGLDKKVLLVVTGEFGRTPRISHEKNRPGRDHWPQAMSVLVSGGGLKMGQVVGSTNGKGEHPKDRPLTPNDLWATVFKHLGVDYKETSFLDHTGRPMPILPHGEPITELL